MALGFGEGGDQSAPLGRAVIGGLLTSTTFVLLALPLIFSVVQRKAGVKSSSVHPRHLLPPDAVVEQELS